MLRVAEASYDYGSKRRPGTRERDAASFSLDAVSVDVPRGTFLGLLGPNGCGKTTLLSLMAGLLKPSSGAIALDGDPLATIPRRRLAQRVALVPQETHPAFDYSAFEMVMMGRHPHVGPFALEGPDDVLAAERALEATGTAHLAARSYMTLSGGEKQRVIIAAALAQSPDLLLLDEPTASLDLGFQLDIAALLRRLNKERGVTLVLATHDLNLAAATCDTLMLLRGGRVLAHGPTAEVLTADAVARLYGVSADVSFHPGAGHVTVVPVTRTEASRR